MPGSVKLKTNAEEFSLKLRQYARLAGYTFEAAFKAEGRLLCDRLIKFTPPFTGASIKRSLWSRSPESMADYKAFVIARNEDDLDKAFAEFSPFRDPEIEDMSARQIGERRVEKDIRKVIKGVRGATMPVKENPVLIISQTNPRSQNQDIQVDWGVRQKCQGRDAIRIYADRTGNVYGVDTENFLPTATEADLQKVHQEHRGKRGRVTTAGSKDLVVGRWRWLNIVVAPQAAVQAYIEKLKKMVGQGKGGWAAAYMKLGGKLSPRGWIGRHANAGSLTGWPPANPGNIKMTITNNSAWASNGDPDRVIENALASRERDMERKLKAILEGQWDEKMKLQK